MIEKLKSKISLNIKGKNINRFIKKLRTKKIEILNIKYINKNEADIIIYKKDYAEILKIKSIYEITELDVFGLIKIKRNLKISKHHSHHNHNIFRNIFNHLPISSLMSKSSTQTKISVNYLINRIRKTRHSKNIPFKKSYNETKSNKRKNSK